jgi:short-subunit dehydrogenase
MAVSRWKRALVVGASSGLGEAVARRLAREGATVALVARREQELDRVRQEINAGGEGRALVFPADARETERAGPLFQEIAAALGGLDLVVYAAGILPRTGLDQYDTASDVDVIDTNFAGAVAWLNEAADRFARAGGGTIIGISSVAGDRGRRGNPVYNASKAALNSYLESLRNRLSRRGVTVLTVKPGYVRTQMIDRPDVPGFVPTVSPDEAAAQMLDAAGAGKRVIYVPGWWRWIMAVVKAIPAPLFERSPL